MITNSTPSSSPPIHPHPHPAVAVLEAIEARERELRDLAELAADVGSSVQDLPLAQVAAAVRGLMLRIGHATLCVAVAVAEWRSGLTRAFPFLWRGQNYLVKCANDTAFLRSSPLVAYINCPLFFFFFFFFLSGHLGAGDRGLCYE